MEQPHTPPHTRRDFLKLVTAGAAAGALSRGAIARPQAAERPITHLPADYKALLALSDEQKILLSAATASGCDAVAYYTPGESGFTLDKHIDLYAGNDTRFAPALENNPHGNATTILPGADGKSFSIPMRADGHLKGIVVLHAPDTPYYREEPEVCRRAKLRMAQHILDEHADLFGVGGAVLKQREDSHKSPERKRAFLTRMIKDMFSSFTRAIEVDPQTLPGVTAARNASELKAAFRKASAVSDSDQYSHVLGVTDLMEHALTRAVNGDAAHPAMRPDQVELMELLTLLHDVGKTQIPSQFFNDIQTDQAGTDYIVSRNGSHPLHTLLSLLLYEKDAIDAAAHHHGFKRYGPEEMANLKARKRVSPGFAQFTELAGADIAPEDVPPLAKMMRVADVAEAMTGRADLPLHEVLRQLGSVAETGAPPTAGKIRLGEGGKPVINPDTIDPDYLCFLLANGVFKAYGEQRTAETGGWLNRKKDAAKYDAAEVEKITAGILHRFGWDTPEAQAEKSRAMRGQIARDPLLAEAPAQRAEAAIAR